MEMFQKVSGEKVLKNTLKMFELKLHNNGTISISFLDLTIWELVLSHKHFCWKHGKNTDYSYKTMTQSNYGALWESTCKHLL